MPRAATARKDMLTREEELSLIIRSQAGDVRALGEIMKRFEPMLSGVSATWARNKNDTHDDAFQDARRGLMRAVEKFDRNKGFRLSTYARMWVTEYMRMGHHMRTKIVSEPNSPGAAQIRRQVAKEMSDLGLTRNISGAMAKGMAVRRVAEMRGETPENVLKAFDYGSNTRVSSLDREVVSGDFAVALIDLMVSPEPCAATAHEALSVERYRARIIEVGMGSLSEREREVIRCRFLSDPVQSLEEVSLRLGVSRERVRQIEGRAIRLMREGMISSAGSARRVMDDSGLGDHEPRYEKIRNHPSRDRSVKIPDDDPEGAASGPDPDDAHEAMAENW